MARNELIHQQTCRNTVTTSSGATDHIVYQHDKAVGLRPKIQLMRLGALIKARNSAASSVIGPAV